MIMALPEHDAVVSVFFVFTVKTSEDLPVLLPDLDKNETRGAE